MVAWRKFDEMPGVERTLPWLYGIARYEVSVMRRTGRRLEAIRRRLKVLMHSYALSPDAVSQFAAELETDA